MKKYKSGCTEEQRKIIRDALDRFTREHASLLGCTPQAVVQEMRYWQQSNRDWRTNPTRREQKESFSEHRGICVVCKEVISSINDATFHHWHRGIENLHSPTNMVPAHKQKGCHEKLHGARPGSFTEGSMSRK